MSFIFSNNLINKFFWFIDLKLAEHIILNIAILIVEISDCDFLHLSEYNRNEQSLLDFTFDLTILEKLISNILKFLFLHLKLWSNSRQCDGSCYTTKYSPNFASLSFSKGSCHQVIALKLTTWGQTTIHPWLNTFLDKV